MATDNIWRHRKRRTQYRELMRVELQASTRPATEGDRLVVYAGSGGKLWARREDEFDDGRFELVQ